MNECQKVMVTMSHSFAHFCSAHMKCMKCVFSCVVCICLLKKPSIGFFKKQQQIPASPLLTIATSEGIEPGFRDEVISSVHRSRTAWLHQASGGWLHSQFFHHSCEANESKQRAVPGVGRKGPCIFQIERGCWGIVPVTCV